MARATLTNKTHGLKQLSFTKQKAQPNVQALTRAEYCNMKQAEKTQNPCTYRRTTKYLVNDYGRRYNQFQKNVKTIINNCLN